MAQPSMTSQGAPGGEGQPPSLADSHGFNSFLVPLTSPHLGFNPCPPPRLAGAPEGGGAHPIGPAHLLQTLTLLAHGGQGAPGLQGLQQGQQQGQQQQPLAVHAAAVLLQHLARCRVLHHALASVQVAPLDACWSAAGGGGARVCVCVCAVDEVPAVSGRCSSISRPVLVTPAACFRASKQSSL